ADAAVVEGDREGHAVGGERDGRGPRVEAVRLVSREAGRGVPKEEAPGAAGRRDRRAVRTEPQGGDRGADGGGRAERGAGQRVPAPDQPVFGRRRDERPGPVEGG